MQDNRYSDQDFLQLHEVFHDETEHGKLFVSYPMVEAIRHQPPQGGSFADLTIGRHELNQYKSLSAQVISNWIDIKKITQKNWEDLVEQHVWKAYRIETGQTLGLQRNTTLDLKKIAQQQVTHINNHQKMYVLSALPLFLFHQMPFEFNII